MFAKISYLYLVAAVAFTLIKRMRQNNAREMRQRFGEKEMSSCSHSVIVAAC